MSYRGQIASIIYKKTLKVRKEYRDKYFGERISSRLVRVGVEYENLASTKEIRQTGIQPTGLKGFSWIYYPIVLKNTEDDLYIRLYPFGNNDPKVRYFLNGDEYNLEEIQHYFLASELESSKDSVCINVKLNNIIAIK